MSNDLSAVNAALDPRRKRLLYRANHRGMRELDMLIGQFAESRVATLSDAEADEFERLLDVQDPDMLAWITGVQPVPAEVNTPFFREMVAFQTQLSPNKL